MVLAVFPLVASILCSCALPHDTKQPEAVGRETTKMENQADEVEEIERIAIEYLKERKHWEREQYKLEHKGKTKEGYAIVWALFTDDQKKPQPGGGGSSVELHIDIPGKKVVRELKFQ
jgi:hypothetical protein